MNIFQKMILKFRTPKVSADDLPQESKYGNLDVFAAEERASNSFYQTVSVSFRIAEFLLITVFLLFSILSAFGNAANITQDNLEYIVRDFALKLEENRDSSSVTIRYNPDADRSFTLFGDGLAVCGMSGINIFSATGRRVCNETFDYLRPMMSASDKYAVVYEEGGKCYSVYNTFTRVYESELEYEIRGVDVADNGYYAIITGDAEYSSCVEVYNSNFKLINKYRKNGYVVSVDIDNENIVICTLSVSNDGAYSTEIINCTLGDTDVSSKTTVDSYFPLACSFSTNGYYAVFKEAVCFFDGNGKLASEYSFRNETLFTFDSSDSGVLLVFKGDAMSKEYTAVSLDFLGKERAGHTFTGTVYSVELFENDAYILTDNCIINISESGISESVCDDVDIGTVLLSYDDGKLYFCGRSNARIIDFE